MLNITSTEETICGICEKRIEENDVDAFDCDLCDGKTHLECAEGRKSDVKARKGSKCVRIYCPKCLKDGEMVVPTKLNEINKMIYKVDMSCQQQKAGVQSNYQMLNEIMKLLQTMNEKMESMDNRLEKVESNGFVSHRDDVQPSTSSFADSVKSSVPKSVVVVKPKKKQHSKKTLEQITSSIDKSSVNVCGTRSARDGGIILCCKNSADTMKVKQIVRDKLGEDYDVTLPTIKNPRLRITNIDTDIPDDSIIETLKKNNELIANDEVKLVTIIPRKFRGTITNDIVVEVKSATYKKLLKAGVVHLPWRECEVKQHIYIKRCFKCCGFSHTAQQCKQNTQYCSKCAGTHKFDSCKNKKLCCINCKVANDKFGLNLNAEHHAWSKDCKVLSRKMQTLREKIEYNESE